MFDPFDEGDDSKRFSVSFECEKLFEWRKWMQTIPFIQFPQNWMVQIIPPFAGAIIRFRVMEKGYPGKAISAYLDGYSLIGAMWDEDGKAIPYWEIYPNAEGSTSRFLFDDVEGLLKGISDALAAIEK